jgi:3-oxoacyl-[acyl-carrier-protein] synthase III
MVQLSRILNIKRGRQLTAPRDYSPPQEDSGVQCSIRAIHYELGDLRSIEAIAGIDSLSSEFRSLRDGRLRHYAVGTGGPLQLAASCVSRTLTETACAPQEIQTVVLASERCLQTSRYEELNSFFSDMGLTRALPIGIYLSGCTNATVALRVASSIRQTEHLESVLVVGMDTLLPEAAHRVQAPGACVFSDAAVSFLVGPPGAGDFDVLGVEHVTSPQIGRLELRQNSLAAIRECMAGPRDAVKHLLARNGLRPEEIACFLNANLVYGLALAQAKMCGFKPSQCYLDNIPRFAHTYAGDPFINLRDACAQNRVADGEYVLLLGTAATSWGAVLLRKSKAIANGNTVHQTGLPDNSLR